MIRRSASKSLLCWLEESQKELREIRFVESFVDKFLIRQVGHLARREFL